MGSTPGCSARPARASARSRGWRVVSKEAEELRPAPAGAKARARIRCQARCTDYAITYGKTAVPVYRHGAAPLTGLAPIPESPVTGLRQRTWSPRA